MMFNTFTQLILSLPLLAVLAQAHNDGLRLFKPDPIYYNKPNRTYGQPLKSFEFPCRGQLKDIEAVFHEPRDEAKFNHNFVAGKTYNYTLGGDTEHSHGGSCQTSLSYDNGTTWKVIQSHMGDCPGKGRDTYDITIPKEAPTKLGALWAWSWVNRNQQFFMDCSMVNIINLNHTDLKASLADFPDMFVGNVFDDCKTEKSETCDTQFPNPGKNVKYGKDSKGNKMSLKFPTGPGCTSCQLNNTTGPSPKVSSKPPSKHTTTLPTSVEYTTVKVTNTVTHTTTATSDVPEFPVTTFANSSSILPVETEPCVSPTYSNIPPPSPDQTGSVDNQPPVSSQPQTPVVYPTTTIADTEHSPPVNTITFIPIYDGPSSEIVITQTLAVSSPVPIETEHFDVTITENSTQTATQTATLTSAPPQTQISDVVTCTNTAVPTTIVETKTLPITVTVTATKQGTCSNKVVPTTVTITKILPTTLQPIKTATVTVTMNSVVYNPPRETVTKTNCKTVTAARKTVTVTATGSVKTPQTYSSADSECIKSGYTNGCAQ